MAESGGIRFDYTEEAHLVPGEDRTLRIRARDADDDEINDFTGYEFAFYFLRTEDQPIAEALFTKTTGAGITTSSPPFVDVSIARADWVDFAPGSYWYECYRTDTGNYNRVAYGLMRLLH